MNDYEISWNGHSADTLADYVTDAIINLAGDIANEKGNGWIQIREALEKLFENEIEVIDDDNTSKTIIRRK